MTLPTRRRLGPNLPRMIEITPTWKPNLRGKGIDAVVTIGETAQETVINTERGERIPVPVTRPVFRPRPVVTFAAAGNDPLAGTFPVKIILWFCQKKYRDS